MQKIFREPGEDPRYRSPPLYFPGGGCNTDSTDISREAKVSTGTLLHYFPDKSPLEKQLYLSIKRNWRKISPPSKDDKSLPTKMGLDMCLHGYVKWGVANPGKARFLDQFIIHRVSGTK